MGLNKPTNSRKSGRFFFIFLLIVVLGGGGASYFLFFEGKAPTVNLDSIPEYLGAASTLNITTSDVGSGLRKVNISASQKNTTKELYSHSYPRSGYTGPIGPMNDTQELPFDAKKLGFEDGEITISVTASDYSFRGFLSGNTVTASKTFTLDTKPPRLGILHSERYIAPGGAGIAIYTMSDDDTEHHGVMINSTFNKGYPIGDGRENTFIAYFGLPYDATEISEARVIATDIAGNTSALPFSPIFKDPRQKHDRINISDGFLNTKVPEFEQYYPDIPGDMVEKYLHINRNIRQENNKQIAELCSEPVEDRLWQGRFHRMAGAGRAGFADHRTYYYNDKAIDKQVHLGMDIASTRRAVIKAANAGKVVFSDYLGIYGKMVLIDHGQGVFSLYSHLSQLNVNAGDMVATGDNIGNSGTSGMAGGDHLHFSMLINGVFVTPIEWWDPNWIKITIDEPIVESRF